MDTGQCVCGMASAPFLWVQFPEYDTMGKHTHTNGGGFPGLGLSLHDASDKERPEDVPQASVLLVTSRGTAPGAWTFRTCTMGWGCQQSKSLLAANFRLSCKHLLDWGWAGFCKLEKEVGGKGGE